MIGIRGGTFDPVHFAHLRATEEVAIELGLERVHLIPGSIPPHRRQPLASPEQRLEMLTRAIGNNDKFIADDRELRREGESFTVDTLKSFRNELGDEVPIALIIGMDAFLSFTQWHDWKTIITLAHLVVTSRPDYTAQPLQDWAQSMQTDDKQKLSIKPGGHLYFVNTTALSISATDIRQQRHAGRSIRYLVPHAVHDYIQQHKLYSHS
ncbi:MAG: nicotinate-nucleotide adenylyltransferase [Leucothrix sp.]